MIYLITHYEDHAGVELFFVESDIGFDTIESIAKAVAGSFEHPEIVFTLNGRSSFIIEPTIINIEKYVHEAAWWKDDDQLNLAACNGEALGVIKHSRRNRKKEES